MIIIEANEIPKSVFEWYAKNSRGMIADTIRKFGITETILDDVEEEYLYPSQAWASISTGLEAKSHKIRWYNDAKADSDFYWRNLAKEKKISSIILRYFNVSGADKKMRSGLMSNSENLIKAICEVATNKKELFVINGEDYNTKDGTAIRDYIHIEDLSKAHTMAYEYIKNSKNNYKM